MKNCSYVKLEAEVGAVIAQAKEYLRLEEVRQEGPFSGGSERKVPLVTPPLGLLAPSTVHSFLSVWQSPIVVC